MKNFHFLTYHVASKSCKVLRDDLRAMYDEQNEKRSITRHSLNADGFNRAAAYKNSLIPVWGSAKYSTDAVLYQKEYNKNTIINGTAGHYSNKLAFLQNFESKYTVPYGRQIDTVRQWLDEGNVVVARMRLDAHSGEGIVLIDSPEKIIQAPLYTKYIKKESEFRVHINKLNDNVIVQQKKKRLDAPVHEETYKIRNLQNGWVYTREDVKMPRAVEEAAFWFKNYHIFKSYIDFCALDIIYNKQTGSAYILEMNLAPGLAGQTVRDYANLMNDFHKKHYE